MANGSLSPTTRIVCAVNVYAGSFRHPLEQLHSFSMTCENSRQQVRLGENRGNSPRAALSLEIALARTGVTDQQTLSEERRCRRTEAQRNQSRRTSPEILSLLKDTENKDT